MPGSLGELIWKLCKAALKKPEKKEDNSKWEATVMVVVARLV